MPGNIEKQPKPPPGSRPESVPPFADPKGEDYVNIGERLPAVAGGVAENSEEWELLVQHGISCMAGGRRLGWEWCEISFITLGPKSDKHWTQRSSDQFGQDRKLNKLLDDMVAASRGRCDRSEMPSVEGLLSRRAAAEVIPYGTHYRKLMGWTVAKRLMSIPEEARLPLLDGILVEGRKLTQENVAQAIKEWHIAAGTLIPADKGADDDKPQSNVVSIAKARAKTSDPEVESDDSDDVAEALPERAKGKKAKKESALDRVIYRRVPRKKENKREAHVRWIDEGLMDVLRPIAQVQLDLESNVDKIRYVTSEEAAKLDNLIGQIQSATKAIKKYRKSITIKESQ